MPKAVDTKQKKPVQRGKKNSKKYGRPPRPKGPLLFEEDSRYSKVVVDALAAYLTFTEEVGMPHGYYLNTVEAEELNEDVKKTVGRIQLPPTILVHHRGRLGTLIEMTRLSMDQAPAKQFEKIYCLAYKLLSKGNDRKEVVEQLLKSIRQTKREEFPCLNLEGVTTFKSPIAPFEKMISALVACLDQHLLSRKDEDLSRRLEADNE